MRALHPLVLVTLAEKGVPGHLVTAMSTTVHENPEVFGERPREFNGFQWAETGKEAVMTGPAHIVFGLGRFACPGRVLAVNGTSRRRFVLYFDTSR